MILPVLTQGGLFLGSVAAGLALAFFYDIFRVWRRIVPHKSIFIHIEDIIYWLIVIGIMFFFMLTSNSGEVRLFAIVGAFIGMLVYFNFVSPVFMGVSMAVYAFLRKVIVFAFNVVMTPFRAIAHILSVPANFAAKKAKKLYAHEKQLYRRVRASGRYRAGKIKNNLRIIMKKI